MHYLNTLFRHKYFLLIILLSILLVIYYSSPLVVTHYTVYSSSLPSSFNNYLILQLSDVHIDSDAYDSAPLIRKIKLHQPDLIVITGDLITCSSYAFTPCLDFLKQLVSIAPTYYIYGNHEVFMEYSPYESEFLKKIPQTGVTVLNHTTTQILSIAGETITLTGISDPVDVNSSTQNATPLELENMNHSLEPLKKLNETDFNLLLAHRPEYTTEYSNYPIDLILSGHAHGGIIRIPFLCGLYAPNQGYFPKYTSGQHQINHSKLIISRGLGTSSISLRIFNPPELVYITLHSSK